MNSKLLVKSVLFASLCLPALAAAQIKPLTGRIVDPSGLPVAGAIVSLLKSETSSLSNDRGTFVFSGNRYPKQEKDASARRLGKTSTFKDTLRVRCPGYFLKVMAISSNRANLGDIAIKPVTLIDPTAPKGLCALGRDGEVKLVWNNFTASGGVTVNRAVQSGGPYSEISSGLADTAYTDASVSNGGEYFYVIAGLGTGNSIEARARPVHFDPQNLFGHELSYPIAFRGKVEDVAFRLWIPENTPLVKAVMIFGEYGGGKTLSRYAELRFLASDLGCAIMAFSGTHLMDIIKATGPDAIPGQVDSVGQAITRALTDLAAISGHPEIAHAPVSFFGHSNATPFCAKMTAWMAHRVFCWIAFKSAFGSQFSESGAYQVPTMVISGELDKSYFIGQNYNQLSTVKQLRAEHGALMHMIVEPGGGHGEMGTDTWTIVMAFIKTAFQLRIPPDINTSSGPVPLLQPLESEGWLGDYWDIGTGGGQQLDYDFSSNFEGAPSSRCWLPSEEYARKWQEFSYAGRVQTWW